MGLFIGLTYFVIALGLGIVISTSWGIHCMNKALEQRKRMLWAIPLGSENAPELVHDINSVSFEHHVRELIRLHDPMNLYSDELLAVVQEKGAHREASVL